MKTAEVKAMFTAYDNEIATLDTLYNAIFDALPDVPQADDILTLNKWYKAAKQAAQAELTLQTMLDRIRKEAAA